MAELFPDATPEVPKPKVTYLPKVAAAAPFSLDAFLAELPLGQRTAHMYGKALPVPRLECWYGLRPYRFGGRVEHPAPWTPLARSLCGGVTRLATQAGPSRVVVEVTPHAKDAADDPYRCYERAGGGRRFTLKATRRWIVEETP